MDSLEFRGRTAGVGYAEDGIGVTFTACLIIPCESAPLKIASANSRQVTNGLPQ